MAISRKWNMSSFSCSIVIYMSGWALLKSPNRRITCCLLLQTISVYFQNILLLWPLNIAGCKQLTRTKQNKLNSCYSAKSFAPPLLQIWLLVYLIIFITNNLRLCVYNVLETPLAKIIVTFSARKFSNSITHIARRKIFLFSRIIIQTKINATFWINSCFFNVLKM